MLGSPLVMPSCHRTLFNKGHHILLRQHVQIAVRYCIHSQGAPRHRLHPIPCFPEEILDCRPEHCSSHFLGRSWHHDPRVLDRHHCTRPAEPICGARDPESESESESGAESESESESAAAESRNITSRAGAPGDGRARPSRQRCSRMDRSHAG